MAIRTIRISTDEVLRKTCKEVKEITPNLITLLDDIWYIEMGNENAKPVNLGNTINTKT